MSAIISTLSTFKTKATASDPIIDKFSSSFCFPLLQLEGMIKVSGQLASLAISWPFSHFFGN